MKRLGPLMAALVLTGCQHLPLRPDSPATARPEQAATAPTQPQPTGATPHDRTHKDAVSEKASPSAVKAAQHRQQPATELVALLRQATYWDRQQDLHHFARWRDYLLRHPQHLQRVLERARPFLPLIISELKHRNMPLELALLPVVESGYRVEARSWQGAAGLWQITRPTARHLKLKVNWWIDQRLDPLASTHAALDYLQQLHQQTGDWLLALAAYNAGLGNVWRAQKQFRGHNGREAKNFWQIQPYLPRETRNYVPQLLAVLNTIRSLPAEKLPRIALEPALRQLTFSSQIDLQRARQNAGVKPEVFARLNAAYRRPYTPPDGPHRLLLPKAAASRLQLALKKTPNLLAVRLKRYRIRPGDSLIRLARRFNTRPDELRRLNKLLSNTLIAGRTLLVPATSLSGQSAQHTKLARHRAPALRHRIRRGESLWTIARRYGVSVRQLARYNGLSVHRALQPGQLLNIPLKRSGRRPITHTVRPGESLWLLARRYGATVDALRRWNGLSAHPVLRPGQKLIILAAQR